jgi:hypothetical protein
VGPRFQEETKNQTETPDKYRPKSSKDSATFEETSKATEFVRNQTVAVI